MSTESIHPEPDKSEAVQQPVVAVPGTLKAGPLAGLAFALLGAVLAWAVLQLFFPAFTVPEELVDVPMPAPSAKVEQQLAAMAWAERCNAILILGLFGVLLGVLLAASEGIARRSIRTVLVGGAVCALVGGLFGSLGAHLGSVNYEPSRDSMAATPLEKTIQAQSIVFATLGGGIGLALGGLAGWRRAAASILAGIMAGVLAGMVYPFVAGTLMPICQTESLVPQEVVNRLVWFGIAAGLLGMLIPATTLSRRRR